jgi:nitroimidazol reductase NimA-like FMN-containing flavoprotein (pyridoxamine 5'-phosphate oxidase superfamily)
MIHADTLHDVTSLDECWSHLDRESFGRLAVATDVGVDIFPVNFTVHDREIYLRSAPGSKLVDILKRPGVAFEIDGRQSGMHWSVVVKGDATRMSSDAEIRACGVLALHTATPTAKWNYIRIQPDSVTGRRFSLLEVLSEPSSTATVRSSPRSTARGSQRSSFPLSS